MKNKKHVDLSNYCFIFINDMSIIYNLSGTQRVRNFAKNLSEIFEVYVFGSTSLHPNYKRIIDIDANDFKNVNIINVSSIEILKNFKKPFRVSSENKNINYFKKSFLSNYKKIFILLLRRFWNLVGPLIKIKIPMIRFNEIHNVKKLFEEINNLVEKKINERKKIVLFSSYTTLQFGVLKIAKKLKNKYGDNIFWIADLRDPIYKNPHGGWILKYKFFSKVLAKKYLKESDLITCVSQIMVKQLIKEVKLNKKKIAWLPNGFSSLNDFQTTIKKRITKNFKIVYTGSLLNRTKEFESFVKLIPKIKKYLEHKNKILNFVYAGKDSQLVLSTFKKYNLLDVLIDRKYLNRKETLELQSNSDLLLLISDYSFNGAAVTGKVYEYLASGKPILVIAPNTWEMKDLLQNDDSILIVDLVKSFETHKLVLQFVEKLLNNDLDTKKIWEIRKNFLDSFQYNKLSEDLINVVRTLINKT